MPLGRKIALLAVVGLGLGGGVFAFLSIQALGRSTDVMLEERLTVAGLVADYTDHVLARAMSELESTMSPAGADNPDEIVSRLGHLEDMYSEMAISIPNIFLLDDSGIVTWSRADSSRVTGMDMSYFPCVNEAMEGGKPCASGLVATPFIGTPVILLACGTQGGVEESSTTLVVAADLAQSAIEGFIHPIRLGETGYVEIVDQNGIVIARTNPGHPLTPFEKSDHPERFVELINTGEVTVGTCHTCHVEQEQTVGRDVLAFAPLSVAPWGVVVRQSESEALAPTHDLARRLLYSGIGLSVVAFFFTGIVTQRVVRRIRTLTAACERVSRGDLDSPVSPLGKDEIGTLAQTFDDMRMGLRESRASLEQRTRELSSLLAVSETLTSTVDLSKLLGTAAVEPTSTAPNEGGTSQPSSDADRSGLRPQSIGDLDAILNLALDRALELVGENSGGILLLNEQSQTLAFRVSRGLSDRFLRGTTGLKIGEGVPGLAVKLQEPVHPYDIAKDSKLNSPAVKNERLHAYASVPIRSKGRVLGAMDVVSHNQRRFDSQEIHLLNSIGNQVAIAIENTRLYEEVQRHEEMQRELLRQIISTQEDERRRIARGLHDETSQALTGFTISLETAIAVLPRNATEAKDKLRQLQTRVVETLDEIHRVVYELRPTILDDLGLVSAVQWHVENYLGPTGIEAHFETEGDERRLSLQVETALFRIVQEASTNIVRHSEAESASVALEFNDSSVAIHIEDDGKGFDIREVMSKREGGRGLGLLGMRERAEFLGGTCRLWSRPGFGTQLDIEIPIDEVSQYDQDTSTGSR
jgi:signal transduction histidine kinase/HAMP domain-containing protein